MLIDKKIECLYHEEHPDEVDVRWNGLSYGRARVLDRAVNARIGRDWSQPRSVERESMAATAPEMRPGELFGTPSCEEVGDETRLLRG